MRRALPFLFILISVAMFGCADKQAKVERRPKIYRSVVSLSPSTTEIIATDADSNTLKGRTRSCNYPPNLMAVVPVVADVKPDYERIMAIKPDMIVYDKGLYTDQDIDKLKASGADIYGIDAVTVSDFIKQMYVLGGKLGWETRFNDYLERVYTEQKACLAEPVNPKPKVAVVLPGPGGDDYICGADSFIGDVIRIAGGQIVGPKGAKFEKLNAEAFVALNPDEIFVNGTPTDVSGHGLVMNDPRFKTITAVKTGHVSAILSDVLLRRGQRVDELMKQLHNLLRTRSK